MAKDISKEVAGMKTGKAKIEAYGGNPLSPVSKAGSIKVDCDKK